MKSIVLILPESNKSRINALFLVSATSAYCIAPTYFKDVASDRWLSRIFNNCKISFACNLSKQLLLSLKQRVVLGVPKSSKAL
jgi:hypothetical protein